MAGGKCVCVRELDFSEGATTRVRYLERSVSTRRDAALFQLVLTTKCIEENNVNACLGLYPGPNFEFNNLSPDQVPPCPVAWTHLHWSKKGSLKERGRNLDSYPKL